MVECEGENQTCLCEYSLNPAMKMYRSPSGERLYAFK
jgi:hypothetical protein